MKIKSYITDLRNQKVIIDSENTVSIEANVGGKTMSFDTNADEIGSDLREVEDGREGFNDFVLNYLRNYNKEIKNIYSHEYLEKNNITWHYSSALSQLEYTLHNFRISLKTPYEKDAMESLERAVIGLDDLLTSNYSHPIKLDDYMVKELIRFREDKVSIFHTVMYCNVAFRFIKQGDDRKSDNAKKIVITKHYLSLIKGLMIIKVIRRSSIE